jgi:hypothetical protein
MNNESQSSLSGTSQAPSTSLSRREFVSRSGKLAAASALAGTTLPFVHAAENNTIRLALIGCGGRSSGAAANAFDSPNGPVKMIAMADIFENRLASAHKVLSEKYPQQMDVPPETIGSIRGLRVAAFFAEVNITSAIGRRGRPLQAQTQGRLWLLRSSCQRHSRDIRADPPQLQRVLLVRPSSACQSGGPPATRYLRTPITRMS